MSFIPYKFIKLYSIYFFPSIPASISIDRFPLENIHHFDLYSLSTDESKTIIYFRL